MRKLNLALLALCLFAAAGCGKKQDVEGNRAALRTADTEWSTAANNLESFMTFVAPDATIMPPNEPAVSGTDAIRTWGTKMWAMPGFAISWQPTEVDVAASGDIGYTAGTYTLRMQAPDGSPINDNGKYVTVWKKDTSGAWKVAHDIFNSDLPPAPAAAPMDSSWIDDK